MWQRWNSTTHILEKSTDDGVTWAALPLDGSIISQGTVADARLSGNVAFIGSANIFTANQRVNAGFGVNIAPPSTGNIALSGAVFEASRSVGMGYWTDVAFSTANFGSSAGTLTVDSGDQGVYSYAVVGKILFVSLILNAISLTVATANVITVKIPGGFTCAKETIQSCRILDNGTARVSTMECIAAGTNMRFFSDVSTAANWALSTNNTYIQGIFAIPIS